MTELPEPVSRLLAATNAEDPIAEWDAAENIGVHSRIEATSVRRSGDTVEFGVRVSGEGYNGGGTFTARLRDGRVAELMIRG